MRRASLLICALIVFSSAAYAQEDETIDNSSELDQIEAEIERPAQRNAESDRRTTAWTTPSTA